MADDDKPNGNGKKKKDAQVPVTKDTQVPSYIKQDGPPRGSENVTVNDIALPRIQLAQAMSPCMKTGDAAYIAGIKEGDIYNTLTRENYGSECVIVPVYFAVRWVCWRTRATGGGFRGSFATEKEAVERIVAGQAAGEQIEHTKTHEHLVLVLVGERTEQALLSMSKTQLKQSTKLNSLIQMAKVDSFSRTYLLTSITESNNRGAYKNWNAAPIGFAPEAAYLEAEALYDQVREGVINIVAADEATDGGGSSSDY